MSCCKQCLFEWDEEDIQPRVLLCGHTFCKNCIKNQIQQTSVFVCLNCQVQYGYQDVRDAPINRTLLEYIQEIQYKLQQQQQYQLSDYNGFIRQSNENSNGFGIGDRIKQQLLFESMKKERNQEMIDISSTNIDDDSINNNNNNNSYFSSSYQQQNQTQYAKADDICMVEDCNNIRIYKYGKKQVFCEKCLNKNTANIFGNNNNNTKNIVNNNSNPIVYNNNEQQSLNYNNSICHPQSSSSNSSSIMYYNTSNVTPNNNNNNNNNNLFTTPYKDKSNNNNGNALAIQSYSQPLFTSYNQGSANNINNNNNQINDNQQQNYQPQLQQQQQNSPIMTMSQNNNNINNSNNMNFSSPPHQRILFQTPQYNKNNSITQQNQQFPQYKMNQFNSASELKSNPLKTQLQF